jgi:hypothetical protein
MTCRPGVELKDISVVCCARRWASWRATTPFAKKLQGIVGSEFVHMD